MKTKPENRDYLPRPGSDGANPGQGVISTKAPSSPAGRERKNIPAINNMSKLEKWILDHTPITIKRYSWLTKKDWLAIISKSKVTYVLVFQTTWRNPSVFELHQKLLKYKITKKLPNTINFHYFPMLIISNKRISYIAYVIPTSKAIYYVTTNIPSRPGGC
jgi:hypothetical protein